MAVISAKSLFHFTNEKDTLFKILRNGFRPSYSPEFGKVTGDKVLLSEIPMVCFCDLPLSNIKSHMTGSTWRHNNKDCSTPGYGRYGLGMRKEWGITKGLNPVIYFTTESTYINHSIDVYQILLNVHREYKSIINTIVKENSNNAIVQKKGKQIEYLERNLCTMFVNAHKAFEEAKNLFSYNKPYMDSTNERIYYNEREWRFVATAASGDPEYIPVLFPDQDPEHNRRKQEAIGYIEKSHMLSFAAEDIKYIIVDSDNDIDDLINEMKTIERFDETTVNKLSTRITTYNQIEEDF